MALFSTRPKARFIKSLQRGTITIANASGSNTATVTAVDTSRSFINYLGASAAGTGAGDAAVRLVLTNSTTITATRTLTNGEAIVSYELIECY